jgi:hypothetical protein
MTGSRSVPVNDFGRLPIQPAGSFQIGIRFHSPKFTPPTALMLARLARPKVRPTSFIIMKGRSQGAAGSSISSRHTNRCCSGLLSGVLEEDCQQLQRVPLGTRRAARRFIHAIELEPGPRGEILR